MTKTFEEYLNMTSINDWNEHIEDADDFEEIEENTIDERRWHKNVEHIVKHIPTGRFLSVQIDEPLTEMQECGEYIVVQEVKPVTKTIEVTEYHAV
jgi:hypothetical protein